MSTYDQDKLIDNNNQHLNNTNNDVRSKRGESNENTSNGDKVQLSQQLVKFYDQLVERLESEFSVRLDDEWRDRIKLDLCDYERVNERKLEEKELVISELKQNLLNLTEKRFRSLTAAVTAAGSTSKTQNGVDDASSQLGNCLNIQLLLDEKENQLKNVLVELSEKNSEILKLKQTIKDQDDIILSHNSNIYELKNNNETVLKAKQESFRVMNEDLSRKQKLIDDQNQLIKSLREKIESLEESYEKSRIELEVRLNEKENDLKIKIATFEANLNEGRQYFEEILNEKQTEIERLREALNDSDNNNRLAESAAAEADDSTASKVANLSSSSTTSLQKFDSDNIKNMKSLYEHQIELLKVKIEMLEKTCTNYQQGIKEMNKNFGLQQQSDEIASIQIFKDLMQQLQKHNVQLETERIDLQVKVARLKDDMDELRTEKDNLNKKFTQINELNQRLLAERADLEAYFKGQLNVKTNELVQLSGELSTVKQDLFALQAEYAKMIQIGNEYEQLKLSNQELIKHYEQLYQQANDIVNGNQFLNEQCELNKNYIEQLESQLNELQMKLDHLEMSNSTLNTQKINLEMKVADLDERLNQALKELVELDELRSVRFEQERLKGRLADAERDIVEKNELIDQLNQAKEFLAENNSKLLTNNIKIQLFVESMGLDQSQIDLNPKVNEYEMALLKSNELELKVKQLEIELCENKSINDQLNNQLQESTVQTEQLKRELDASSQADDLKRQLDELNAQNKRLAGELDALNGKLSASDKLNLKLKSKLKQLLKEQEATKPTVGAELAQVKLELEESKASCERLRLSFEAIVAEKALVEAELARVQAELVEANKLPVTPAASVDSEILVEQLKDLGEHVQLLVERNESLKVQLAFDRALVQPASTVDSNVEWKTKLAESERLNLKLKTKLKQLLKEQQKSTNDSSQTEKLTSELTLIHQQKADLESTIQQMKEKIHELESLISQSETIQTERNEFDAKTAQLMSELALIEQQKQQSMAKVAELESTVQEMDHLRKKIEELQGVISTLESVKVQSESIQTEKNELSTKLATMEKQNLKLKAKLKLLMKEQQQAREADRETSGSLLTISVPAVNELQGRLSGASTPDSHHHSLTDVESTSSRLDLQYQIANLDAQLAEKNAKVESTLSENETLLARISLLEHERQQLANQLSDLDTQLREKTALADQSLVRLTELEEVANENVLLSDRIVNLETEISQKLYELENSEQELISIKLGSEQSCAELRRLAEDLETRLEDKVQQYETLTTNSNELTAKLALVEKQNVKLKAKLKQLLKTETNTLASTSSNNLDVEIVHEQLQKSAEPTFSHKSEDEYESLQRELDAIRTQLSESQSEKIELEKCLDNLKQNQSTEMAQVQAQIDDLTNKLSAMEKINIKLKAKCKLLLKEKSETHQTETTLLTTTSQLELQRSATVTPVSMLQQHSPGLATVSTHSIDEFDHIENNIKRIGELEILLNEKTNELNAQLDQLKSIEKEKIQLNAEIDALRDKVDESESLNQRLESLYQSTLAERDQLTQELESKSDDSTLKNRLRQLEWELTSKQDESESNDERSRQLENSLNSLQAEHQQLQHRLNELESLNVRLEGLYQETLTEKGQVQTQIDDLTNKLNTMEKMNLKLKAKCKLLLKEKNETHQTESPSQLELQRSATVTPVSMLQQHSAGLGTVSTHSIDEFDHVESNIKRIGELEGLLNEKTNELNAQLDQLKSIENEKCQLLVEIDSQRQRIAETDARLKSADLSNEQFVLEIQTLKQHIEQLTDELAAKRQLEHELETQLRTLKAQLDQNEHMSRSIMSQNDQVNAKETLEDEHRKLREKLDESESLNQRLESLYQSTLAERDQLTRELESKSDDSTLKNRLRQLEWELTSKQDESESNDERSRQLENSLDSLQAEHQQLQHRLNELESLNVRLEGLYQTTLTEKEHCLSQVSELQSTLNQKLSDLNGLQMYVNNMNQERETFKQYYDQLAASNQSYQQELARLVAENANQKPTVHEAIAQTDDHQLDTLKAEITTLQDKLDSQRVTFEGEISRLVECIRDKDMNLVKLGDVLMKNESELVAGHGHGLGNESLATSTSNLSTMTTSRSTANLEAQLKYCHEKCEKVVLKLSQLKKQNENLNNKIKSIKSMIYV